MGTRMSLSTRTDRDHSSSECSLFRLNGTPSCHSASSRVSGSGQVPVSLAAREEPAAALLSAHPFLCSPAAHTRTREEGAWPPCFPFLAHWLRFCLADWSRKAAAIGCHAGHSGQGLAPHCLLRLCGQESLVLGRRHRRQPEPAGKRAGRSPGYLGKHPVARLAISFPGNLR